MKHATFRTYWNKKVISILDEYEVIGYFEETEIYGRAWSMTRGKTMDCDTFSGLVDEIADDLYK